MAMRARNLLDDLDQCFHCLFGTAVVAERVIACCASWAWLSTALGDRGAG
jgi:hypothetical protein